MICLLDVSANEGQSDALASRKAAPTYGVATGDLTLGGLQLLKCLEFLQLWVKLYAPVCVFIVQIPTLKLFETVRN